MHPFDWLPDVTALSNWIRKTSGRATTARRARARSLFLEPLDRRILLVSDFGDAPDTGAGTGAGNYTAYSVLQGV